MLMSGNRMREITRRFRFENIVSGEHWEKLPTGARVGRVWRNFRLRRLLQCHPSKLDRSKVGIPPPISKRASQLATKPLQSESLDCFQTRISRKT